MRRYLSTLTVLLAASAVAAPGASAASIRLSQTCYPESTSGAPVEALGFEPNTDLALKLDGRTIDATDTQTNDAGAAVLRFVTPSVPKGHGGEQAHRLTVTDGKTTLSLRLVLTKFAANISPSSGKPRRRVKIDLFGFGKGRKVYLHFLAPGSHRLVKTVGLGTVGGACGKGTKRLKHLYPFTPKSGTWLLQFDTQPKYKGKKAPYLIYESTIFRTFK